MKGKGMKMTQGAPKRPGGQGTGHLKAESVNAFGKAPKMTPTHKGGKGGGGSGKSC